MTEMDEKPAIEPETTGEEGALSIEEEIKECGRKLAQALAASSTKAHQQAATALCRALDRVNGDELNELYIKGFIGLAVNGAKRFHFRETLHALWKLVTLLFRLNKEVTLRRLANSIIAAFPDLPNISATIGSSAISPFKWLTRGATGQLSDEDLTLTISALSSLAYYSTTSPASSRYFKKSLKPWISEFSADRIVPSIKKLQAEPANALRLLAFISFVDQVNAAHSIKKIASADFKELLVPHVKKSLLRSPEVALFGVKPLVENVTFDLDDFVAEILAGAQGSLLGHEVAVDVVAALAIGSKDVKNVEKIADTLFAQIAAAKAADVKVGLLKGVARCAATKAQRGAGFDKAGLEIITKTLKVNDGSEEVVRAQWKAIATWAAKMEADSGTEKAFQEASKVPAASKHIVLSGLSDLLETRSISKLPSTAEKSLWSDVEASQKEPLDAISLASILLRTEDVGSDRWTNLLKKLSGNETIFKPKTLGSIDTTTASKWLYVVERLLADGNDIAKSSVGIRSLVLLLLWPASEIRKQARAAVGRLIEKRGLDFAGALAEQTYSEAVSGSADENIRKAKHSSPVSDQWLIPGEWFVQLAETLLITGKTELGSLAIHTLLLASIPRLVEVDGSVWLRWIHSLQQKGENRDWMKSDAFRTQVVEKVLKCTHRNVRDNALITLVSSGIAELKADLWRHIERDLMLVDVPALLKVQDREVAIFRTPAGRLHNTEVLEIDESKDRNVKRENKAYSFADQQAEIEIRRELAERMRKEGKLTPKQKAVMEKELVKEAEVRAELQVIYATAELALDEARAMVNADHQGAFQNSHLLFERGLPLTKSPLIAKEAAQLLYAYRDATLSGSDGALADKVGYWTLRLIDSKWLPDTYTGGDLEEALKKLLSLLQERAFVLDTGEDEDDLLILCEDMVSPAEILLLYPLVKGLIQGSFSYDVKSGALNFIKSALNRNFLRDDSVLQIPILEYGELLLTFIAKSEDDLAKNIATSALTNLVVLVNDTGDTGDRVKSLISRLMKALGEEPKPEIRSSVLQVLSANQLITRLVTADEGGSFTTYCMSRLFIARFDAVESVASAAQALWTSAMLHRATHMFEFLVEECASPFDFTREASGRALVDLLETFPEKRAETIANLEQLYQRLLEDSTAKVDDMGRRKEVNDEWPRRFGMANALHLISSTVTEEEAEKLIHVVVPGGLNDVSGPVRQALLAAAVEATNRHGRAVMGRLLPFLEGMLDNTPDGQAHDNLRQGLVVLLGTLAQHIDKKSEKVRAIVNRLMETLSTPSQTVQESVGRCLAPLVPALAGSVKELVGRLQKILFEGSSYGERRGAAFGIAGFVKGLGMIGLRDLELMPVIMAALSDKKNEKRKEGALLALEIMCSTIGRLFEPYMVKALPTLLVCFGDSNNEIRQAAEDTARAMMGSLTKYGTKLVLPALLTALDDEAWRTKCAAAELLGNMAHCAPDQLSSCLPSIVPKLIEVVTDSHVKVRASGEKALREIAKVIKNPEILGVVNKIMLGLIDPATKTSMSLQTILNTKFIHYIDAPSLALIMPVVRRAFEDRNSETRRFAAQIISNIYSLTDNKDMEPYLASLVPGIQKSLMDPVPEIRAVAAKALGAIISKSAGTTSEKLREEIIPWLKEKLVAEQSTVDRSGAAQGLSEVLAGVGQEQLDHVMPEIIAATEDSNVSAETRDGYILMYIYLPMVFGDRFVQYLPQVVPPILRALADENEYVRASALKAGQRLIAQFCSQARKYLLPQLQRALFDENWRIRHASVQLIGDFLFNISGISGKSTTDTANDDDTMGMEQASKQITRALGQKTRDEVLSGLYLARSDVALVVRNAASHVWKMVVSNTPRTVREMMKVLFEDVVACLASDVEERQQMGARCLGELVRKMGEKILNEVLPILEFNLASEDLSKRVGVAVALHEIIDNVTKDVLQHYFEQIVGPIRKALTDEEPMVREEAAITFSRFYLFIGNDALDEIIAPLLEKLTPDQEYVLAGLCSVMEKNSKQMLPYLLPKLTRPPVNVHALCSLAAVAGDSLNRQLPKILDSLLVNCKSNDASDPMIESCEKVVVAVEDEEGVPLLLDYLIGKAAKGNVPSAVLLRSFIDKGQSSLGDYIEDILPGILQLYASSNEQIVENAILSLIGVMRQADQKEQMSLIPLIRKQVNMLVVGAKGKQVPGFLHPKSLNPLIGAIREGILSGGIETKEISGEVLAQLLNASSPEAIKAHVVVVTGSLIRVLGDRYPPNVKLLILQPLSLLLDKVETFMKPFLPQLQTTFVKALQEPASKQVRLVAAGGLRRLLKIHPKPEPMIVDLWKVLEARQDFELMETTFVAARTLLPSCIAKLSKPVIDEGLRVCALTFNKAVDAPNELDNNLTMVSGSLLGELAVLSGQESTQDIFKDTESNAKPRIRQAKAYAFQQMCLTDGKKIWANHEAECRSAIQACLSGDFVTSQAALRAAGYLLIAQGDEPSKDLMTMIAKGLNHQHLDVRRTVSVVLGNVFAAHAEPFPTDVLKTVVPALVNGSKESNSAVRSAAETALVHAFKLFKDKSVYEAYLETEKGGPRQSLEEVHDRTLKRIVKHNEYDLEKMNNIITAP
ncbi:unnamed protein product, partial [Mesorhabditis spiculigera]